MTNIEYIVPMGIILNHPKRIAVYGHYTMNLPLWIGKCPITELFRPSDAMRSADWRRSIQNDTVLTCKLFSTYDNEYEALREQYRIIRELNPIVNPFALNAPKLYSGKGKIMCNETGTTYDSASKACAELGINRGNMSKHLMTNNPATLKGLTFRYV